MNIKGTRDQFLNCLQKVSSTAPGGGVNPILSNVLLRAGTDSVDIVATDQETQIKSTCEAKGNEKFNATVSAKKFQGILQRLEPDKKVSFEYQEGKKSDKNPAVNISSGKTRYKLLALSPSEFPLLDEKTDFKPLFKISADELLRALKRVSYASAVNSHRLNLNGVLLESSVEGVRAVATDGHRMAVQNIAEKKFSTETQFILPHKSVSELVRNLPAEEEDAEVEIKVRDKESKDVKFIAPSFELTSRTVTENFPDYKSVIPRNNDKTILMERKELLSSLQRVSVLVDKGSTVVVNFGKNSAKLECTNRENEVATEEVAHVKYEGEALEIGFNVDFLSQMLSSVEETAFEMKILDASSSVLFVPAGSNKRPEFQYVVMPVRL